MKMLEYSDYLTDADWVSISLQFLFAFFIVLYLAFIIYFAFCKTSHWKQ